MRAGSMPGLVLLSVVSAVGLVPTPARACTCAPLAVMTATPAITPTNTLVRLWVPDGLYRTPPVFKIRDATRTDVVAVRRDVRAGRFTVVELAPKRPLAAERRYQVADGAGQIVLEFQTGKGPDTKAPTWTGIKSAEYVKHPGGCCACQTGHPYVIIETTDLADDTAAEQPHVFAVWVAEEPASIDYTRPPLTYVQHWGSVALGEPSECLASNLDLPVGKRIRLGLRPVDLAGNLGEAKEAVLELSSPRPIGDRLRR